MLEDSATGRCIEIEITPEMIEAGAEALYQSDAVNEFSGLDGSLTRAAGDMFRAMLALAPSRYQKPDCSHFPAVCECQPK